MRRPHLLDIVTTETRSGAMTALFEDQLPSSNRELARRRTALAPCRIEKLLPEMGNLYALELTATGETTRTLPMTKSMGERARALISEELDRLGHRVDELYDLATEPTLNTNGRTDTLSSRGLTSPERDELHKIADQLMAIEKVAQEGRRINKRLGGTGAAWDSILAECDDCQRRAQEAYDRKY